MRIVSIFFLIALVFPIAFFLLSILSEYDSKGPLKTFGVANDLIFAVVKPYIICLAIYSLALGVSIFLNIKKKYIANVIFLSVMLVAFVFLPYYLRHI